MKFAAVLVISALAAASAQQECDTLKLIGIVGGTNGAACTAATTYSPATLAIPTGDLLKTVCSTQSCKALLQEISAAVPTECLFNGKQLKSTIVDKFPGECEKALGTTGTPSTTTPAPTNSSGAPATTTGAPSTTTDAPAATTVAPTDAPTTAPNTTGSGSGSGPGSPSDDSVTKGPSGAVPAPAPTNGSPQLTAIVGVLVAAVVTAML